MIFPKRTLTAGLEQIAGLAQETGLWMKAWLFVTRGTMGRDYKAGIPETGHTQPGSPRPVHGSACHSSAVLAAG